jgi:hypothetical protein
VSDGHDLAVLVLQANATPGITPPQIGAPYEPGAHAAGTPALIIGQGRTEASNPTLPAVPHVAQTVIHSDAFMEEIYNPWYWVDDWKGGLMIGAGSSSARTCRGDSGGPLLALHNAKQIQVGVTSFGVESCDVPGAFAELADAQLAWVASLVPAIKTGWGSCRTPTGAAGVPYVYYVSYRKPTGYRDGPYYWDIYCALPGTILPAPPTTTPPGDPEPTIPPICETHPRKCPPDF